MLQNQLIVMFILLLCAFSRPIVLRPVAKMRRAGDAAYFIGLWMCIGALVMLPLFWNEVVYASKLSPFIWLVSLFKGFTLWACIVLMQMIRTHSSSSAEFRGMMTIGILACMNIYFGEVLSLLQWLSVGLLFVLGVVFTLKGHLSSLPAKYKWMFLALIFISALPGVTDQIVLTKAHWYIHFALSGVGIFITSLFYGRSRMSLRERFSDKSAMLAGITWLVSEAIILSLLVTYIPVTLGVMAMTMSVPLTMLVSAVFWDEGHWKEQVLIGGVSYLAILPIILG
jgi:hypothetical protein